MSLQEILAQQPVATADSGEDTLGFIGMPKGYVPMSKPIDPRYRNVMEGFEPTRRSLEPQIKPPKYKVGAEMEPRSYSPEMIARLQTQLAAAGLIGPETRFRLGVWDAASISAYKNLLAFANQGGIGREEALQTLLANPTVKPNDMLNGGGGAGGGAPVPQGRLNTYEASDPASVRQTAEAAFRQTLGRKPKKEELDKFVSTFLGNERGSQETVFKAQERLEARNQAAVENAAAGGAPASGGGSEADILWERLQRLIADAPGKVTPGKRSRSYEEQVALYNKYKAGKGPLAAKPGTSKHGDGRANDLKYDSQATKRWVLQNAGKYGLAFPLLNHGEDWHIEVADGTLPAGHSVNDGHNHGAATGASMSENVVVQRQDLGAQAVEYARNVNPDETAAYDIGQQFNSLLAILSKGVV